MVDLMVRLMVDWMVGEMGEMLELTMVEMMA